MRWQYQDTISSRQSLQGFLPTPNYVTIWLRFTIHVKYQILAAVNSIDRTTLGTVEKVLMVVMEV